MKHVVVKVTSPPATAPAPYVAAAYTDSRHAGVVVRQTQIVLGPLHTGQLSGNVGKLAGLFVLAALVTKLAGPRTGAAQTSSSDVEPGAELQSLRASRRALLSQLRAEHHARPTSNKAVPSVNTRNRSAIVVVLVAVSALMLVLIIGGGWMFALDGLD